MGCGLSDAVQLQRCFPPSLGFFLRWGEKNAAVSDALDSVNMIYESRAKKLAASFAGFITPLVYIFVILLVGIVVLSVFLPLFSLISSLSYSMHRPPATEAFPPDFILMQMLGVLEAGVILLVVKLVLYWSRWPLKRQLFENVLNFLGWAMAFAATTFLLVFCVNVLVGVFWILAVPSFVILTQFRKMRANQQSFLWLLAMAAEKNMPLAPALTAFAQETGGRFGNRILELSAMLREGIDLPDALRMVPDLIPEEHMTIICSAEKSGVLAQGLRAAASSCDKEKEGWGLLSGKLAYLLGMVLVTCGLLTFIMIKIIPSFEKIFKDFGEKLPDVTLALIGAANHSLIFWPILTLAMIFVALAFLYSFFRYLGFRVIDLPGVERLLWRKHSANILDNLAISVENNRTINAGLGTLAQCYPTASIRVRLSAALVEIAEGDSWLGCLLRHKLIGKADYAVLQAAQRAGNLPWAMREMAETNRRRLAARMNALAQAAFPPVVLCFGAIFLLLGCALFKPLILLIIQKSC
jgi:protein transport protein HofC